MEKHIKENAGLEAISQKSFKKYLKSMIKSKRKYLDKAIFKPHSYPYGERVEVEYDVYIDVLDTYKYFKDNTIAFYCETTYIKSFKKYLKHMIIVNGKGIDRCIHKSDTDTIKKKFITEYNILNEILDAYIYFQALKKDKKGDRCRI